MVYQWSGYSYKVPAQKVGEELERLEARDGIVTKESVVDSARPEDSVLHGIFEWNDTIAGENWRKQQAKQMLSSLHIVLETQSEDQEPQKVSIRAYTNIANDDSRTRASYRFTIKAVETDRNTILANAARELDEFTRKYRMYSELNDVIAAIEEWKEKQYADAV